MRTELRPLFIYLAKVAQAPDLEAEGSRKDGPAPAHELVKPAARRNRFSAGPKPKVIGITKDDARIEFLGFERLKPSSLHGADGADGHESGRLNHTSPGAQTS